MEKNDYLITDGEIKERCIEGKGNPLASDSVEQNQAVFDAFPKMIAEKFNTFLDKGVPKLLDKASCDATTKAGAAETNAKSYADTAATNKASEALNSAKEYADTKKQEAVSAAASDATTKAGAAETNAKSYADTVATSKASEALNSAKEYADKKSDEVLRTAEKFASMMHGVCERPFRSDEIQVITSYDDVATQLSIVGFLSVGLVERLSKLCFFNPGTEDFFVCTVDLMLPEDAGSYGFDLSDVPEAVTRLNRDAFIERYPYYGIYTGDSYLSQKDLLVTAKEEANDLISAFSNEKVGDTSIAHCTTVAVEGTGVYEVDLSVEPKLVSEVALYDGGDVSYEYHEAADVLFYYEDGTSSNIRADHVKKAVVSNPQPDKLVQRIVVFNGTSNYKIVEYTWFNVEDANVKQYVDNSIQQAILDSWEVSV